VIDDVHGEDRNRQLQQYRQDHQHADGDAASGVQP